MTKVTVSMFMVFLTLALYFNGVPAVNGDEYAIEAKGRDGEKKYSPLWFGPRIGRRKRNPTESIFKNLDRDEIDTLAGAFKNPYALAALNNAAKRQMDFTPRLGRDSAEEEDQSDFVDYISRNKPYIPRLGRRLSPYSPRLGRENDVLLQ